VKSNTDPRFWQCFDALPSEIQQLARERFRFWQRHPFHPTLHFKELRPGMFSVRINQKYRALAREQKDGVVWFWIGTHNDYDNRV
jgi:hypothetical protein